MLRISLMRKVLIEQCRECPFRFVNYWLIGSKLKYVNSGSKVFHTIL